MVNTAERNRIVAVLIPEALHQLRTAVADLERLCQDHDTDNGYIAEAYSKIADLLTSCFIFRNDADDALFDTMRDAQNRTFAALRTWPHEGTRLALQFAEEYEDGRRSVLLRETTFSRAATRLEHDIFRRARRVANAAAVVVIL